VVRIVSLLWMMLILAACDRVAVLENGDTPAPANRAPTVTSTGFTLNQGMDLSETLTASDPENATVTFTKTGNPTHGQILAFAQNGPFTYRPAPGFVGTDSFTVTASDGANTVPATITLTVRARANGGGGTNDAPTVTSTGFTLDQDTELSGTLTASDP